MIAISKLNSNVAAAICALITSALFIGLSVGPAEVGMMATMVA